MKGATSSPTHTYGAGKPNKAKMLAGRTGPCLVLKLPAGDVTHLILLAISGTPPRADQDTLDIPALERRRAGLQDWKVAWITVSEYNCDVAERSVCFDPNARVYGRFSRSFLATIAERFRPHAQSREARIDRT